MYLFISFFKDEVIGQIGIYEFFNKDYTSFLDDDNDIDLDKLDEPLLYSFFTTNYLEKLTQKGEGVGDDDDDGGDDGDDGGDDDGDDGDDGGGDGDDGDDGDGDDGGGDGDDGDESGKLRETVEDAEDTRPKSNWIQNYMNNSNYEIIDNEGGGDCLFACIRDAFEGINDDYSVQYQRKLLSEEVDQNLFDGYKMLYDMFKQELKNTSEQMSKIRKEVKELKKLHSQITNKSKKKEYIEKANQLTNKFKILKREKDAAKTALNIEYRFMKNVNSLENLKAIMLTCEFWGETWAVSTLERILNIKLIVLSSESFHAGDFKNVLLCGQMNDDKLEKTGIFNPKYYLILDYNGIHYKLITYKDRKLFTFSFIPYGLAYKIITICMEKDTGLYSLIPSFRQLKNKGEEDSEKKGNLIDKNTVFQFYSKSRDLYPGKGAGEKIKDEDIQQYQKLSKIKDWRKVLSNFHQKPFPLDGLTWNSVEHYYHANKFKKNNPKFYKKFSLESKSNFSIDPVKAKAAGGKKGIYTKKVKKSDGSRVTEKIILRPKGITVDEDFFTHRQKQTMKKALNAKFTKLTLPKKVLKSTQNATLLHYVRGKQPEVWEHLMSIRQQI